MTKEQRLSTYIQMIEDFLAERSTAEAFSDTFFRAFQDDPSDWDGEFYEALNWVATTCECFTPCQPRSEFDVTEDQLREQCAERLMVLRRLHRRLPQ